jgi:hypothetical protein
MFENRASLLAGSGRGGCSEEVILVFFAEIIALLFGISKPSFYSFMWKFLDAHPTKLP